MTSQKDDLAKLLSRGWVSLNKFAKIIDVSYPTVRRMYHNDQINATQVGGVIRVYSDEVRRFLKEGNLVTEKAGGDMPLAIQDVPTDNE